MYLPNIRVRLGILSFKDRYPPQIYVEKYTHMYLRIECQLSKLCVFIFMLYYPYSCNLSGRGWTLLILELTKFFRTYSISFPFSRWYFVVKLVEGTQSEGATSTVSFADVCFVTCIYFRGGVYCCFVSKICNKTLLYKPLF